MSFALESGLVTTWLAPLDTKKSVSSGSALPVIPVNITPISYINSLLLRFGLQTYDGSAVVEFLPHDASGIGPVHRSLRKHDRK